MSGQTEHNYNNNCSNNNKNNLFQFKIQLIEKDHFSNGFK